MDIQSFNYKYSALTEEEKKEIINIKKQYENKPSNEDKLREIHRLHDKINGTATAWAIAVGVVACLIFGLGMALILEWDKIVFGIIVGVIGFIPMAITYPIYNIVLKKYKDKYGEEIIKLSNELLSE
ncbi:MAG: hypothetical protein J6B04_05925 [Clostridia bacterium]|nr:hypothetical protein [Clostridia bacterium]